MRVCNTWPGPKLFTNNKQVVFRDVKFNPQKTSALFFVKF